MCFALLARRKIHEKDVRALCLAPESPPWVLQPGHRPKRRLVCTSKISGQTETPAPPLSAPNHLSDGDASTGTETTGSPATGKKVAPSVAPITLVILAHSTMMRSPHHACRT